MHNQAKRVSAVSALRIDLTDPLSLQAKPFRAKKPLRAQHQAILFVVRNATACTTREFSTYRQCLPNHRWRDKNSSIISYEAIDRVLSVDNLK